MAKKLIGVTGSLATGKTTVSGLLLSLGAVRCIDADRISHKILDENPAIREKIKVIFGEEVFSGERVNRKKLSAKAFFDREKLNELCVIMHPEIINIIKEEVKGVPDGIVVIDAPLLFEADLESYVDKVIVVTSEESAQVKRARQRGLSDGEAYAVIRNQLSLAEKAERADYIIENNGDMKKLKEGVEKVWQKMMENLKM